MRRMKEFAFFIGCTAPVRAINYEASARRVLKKFDVNLVDIDEFTCCGYPLSAVKTITGLSFAAANLALAEEKELDILAICSACAGTLGKANKMLKTDEKIRDRVNEVISEMGLEYKGGVNITHISRFLYEDVGIEKIKESIVKPLNNIFVAPHYGCHYMRPSDVFGNFDDPNTPKTLDELIEATGASSVDYVNKYQCCGGYLLAINEKIATSMAAEKLENIHAAKADAIALHCPFCAIMYDEYQASLTDYEIPVLYYTQLLGIAMNMDPVKELGVRLNAVKVKKLLSKIEGETE